MAATRFKQIALRAFDDLDLLVGQFVQLIHQLVGEQELANKSWLGRSAAGTWLANRGRLALLRVGPTGVGQRSWPTRVGQQELASAAGGLWPDRNRAIEHPLDEFDQAGAAGGG
jgi:hypothetical protein